MELEDFPAPLPPTKIPRPVTREPIGQKFLCCVCRTTEGVLTCTRCRAVRYCDKACQKKQWPKHKDICADIKVAFEETERTADLLKTFKESPDSDAVNLFEQYLDGINIHENVEFLTYDTAIRESINALESCGDKNGSELAFDLAAGNFMDVMKLRYKEYRIFEIVRNDLLSFLINANLDQEAFNFVRYFYLPYLSIEHQDIETSFTQSEINYFRLFDKMTIALVKYKRMRHLQFEEFCEAVRFKNFMMGTHLKVGKNSHVLKIRGVSLIVDRLSDFILKPLKKRVLKLHEDIEILLKSANSSNRYVIPGLLNPEFQPPIDVRPIWVNAQGFADVQMEYWKLRDARIVVVKTDRAWRLAMIQDKGFLEGFLSRGSLPKPSELQRMQIMVNEHTWKGRECNLTIKELYGHSFSVVFRSMDKEYYLSLEGNEEKKDEGNLVTTNVEENGGQKGEEIVETENEKIKDQNGEGNEGKEGTANAGLMEGSGEKGEENIETANEKITEENGRYEKGEENLAIVNEEVMEGNQGEENEGSSRD